jgi:hypothetical protein
VPSPPSSSHASSVPAQAGPSITLRTVSKVEPFVSSTYVPSTGAVKSRPISEPAPPEHDASYTFGSPVVVPPLVCGATLPRSSAGHAC